MENDFSALSKSVIEAAKRHASEDLADEQAEKSVQHTLLRKEKLPPTQAELKKSEKLKQEVLKEDSAFYDKNKIAILKGTCTRYVNHFGEKYPELKKFPKPAEKDGLEEWKIYLSNLQSVIGGAKAEQRFDSILGGVVQAVEQVNRNFPELFAGHKIYEPVSLAQVVTSPNFLESIDDEKHEIIFTHQSWFSSSYWSRLCEALGKAGVAVALKNKELAMAESTSPETIVRMTQTQATPSTPSDENVSVPTRTNSKRTRK